MFDSQGRFVAGLGSYIPFISPEQQQLMTAELERTQRALAELQEKFEAQQRELAELRHRESTHLTVPSQMAESQVPLSRSLSQSANGAATAAASSSFAQDRHEKRNEDAIVLAMIERRRIGVERAYREAKKTHDELEAEIQRLVSQRDKSSSTYSRVLDYTKEIPKRLKQYEEETSESLIFFSTAMKKLFDDSASLLKKQFQFRYDAFQETLIAQENRQHEQQLRQIQNLLRNPHLPPERRAYFTKLLQPHLGQVVIPLPKSLRQSSVSDAAATTSSGGGGAAAASSGNPQQQPLQILQPKSSSSPAAAVASPSSVATATRARAVYEIQPGETQENYLLRLEKLTAMYKGELATKRETIQSINDDISDDSAHIKRLLEELNPTLSSNPILEEKAIDIVFAANQSGDLLRLQQQNSALAQIFSDLQDDVQKAEKENREAERKRVQEATATEKKRQEEARLRAAEKTKREQEAKAKREAERQRQEEAERAKQEQEKAEGLAAEKAKHEREEKVRREAEQREAERQKQEEARLRAAEKTKREQEAKAKREAEQLEAKRQKQEEARPRAADSSKPEPTVKPAPKKPAPKMSKKDEEEALLQQFEQQQKAAQQAKAAQPRVSMRQEAEKIRRQALLISGEQKKQLLVAALNIYPALQETWEMLPSMLGNNESVIINKTTYTKQQCYERALELAPSNSLIWNNLGTLLLQNPDSIAHVNEKDYTELDCYAKALEINEDDTIALCNLGRVLEEKTVIISGKKYTQKSCFEKGLKINPISKSTWYSLGAVLKGEETIKLQGNIYRKLDCYYRVIQIDPTYHHAWFELGCLLPIREQVPDIPLTKIQCFERVLHLNPEHAEAKTQLALLQQLEQLWSQQVGLTAALNESKSAFSEATEKALFGCEQMEDLQKQGQAKRELETIASQIKRTSENEIALLRKIEQPPAQQEQIIADIQMANDTLELGLSLM